MTRSTALSTDVTGAPSTDVITSPSRIPTPSALTPERRRPAGRAPWAATGVAVGTTPRYASASTVRSDKKTPPSPGGRSGSLRRCRLAARAPRRFSFADASFGASSAGDASGASGGAGGGFGAGGGASLRARVRSSAPASAAARPTASPRTSAVRYESASTPIGTAPNRTSAESTRRATRPAYHRARRRSASLGRLL